MMDIEKLGELETVMQGATNRRTFLTRAAVAGLGATVLGLTKATQAATAPKQPEADTGHDYPMAKPTAKVEKQFRMGVIGPAKLSLLTSQIAVDKATNPSVKEFANFELREAIGVTTVLKELKTPVPDLNAMQRGILKQLQDAPAGAAFDKAYVKAQLANHEFLRDLATSYLQNSMGRTSMAEMHTRHLATLTLGAFKEHVVHCKNLAHIMTMGM